MMICKGDIVTWTPECSWSGPLHSRWNVGELLQVLDIDHVTLPAALALLAYDMSIVEAYEDQVIKVET